MKVERRLIPVMCTCGRDTPTGFGATKCWQDLEKMKTGLNLRVHIFRSDYDIMTELAPKWSSFRVLVMISILLVTPYPALKLTIITKDLNQPYLLNKDNSGGGTHTKFRSLVEMSLTMWISSEHAQNVHCFGVNPTTTVFFIKEIQLIEFYTYFNNAGTQLTTKWTDL